jgi:hypothetical protein
MTIVFDTPCITSEVPGVPCARLMSTLIGYNGQVELRTIARRLKLRKKRLKRQGEFDEHYVLFGTNIDLAKRMIAVEVSRAEYLNLLTAKRNHISSILGNATKDAPVPAVSADQEDFLDTDEIASRARRWRRERRSHEGLAHI